MRDHDHKHDAEGANGPDANTRERPRIRVGYLVNEYPKVSHTFIRREMLELEAQGFLVHRYALRGFDGMLADAADLHERDRTAYLLRNGMRGLALDALRALLDRPLLVLGALRMALRMARRADRSLSYHLVYLAEACRLSAWMRRDRVQHLHAHFGTNPAEVAMLAAHIGQLPFSFTVHGPEEFDKPAALHLADKIRAAAFVVAISSFGRSQLFRVVEHAQWHKIKVVHCALEPAFHAGAGVPPPQVPRLVCVGRLCEQKGQLLLLDAVAMLVARGIVIDLVLAGDGEMRASIEARIRQLHLGDMVSITGWIDSGQVREIILGARALVLPSFAEGLPVVLMEAMALGRPVLTTWVAGIPELVRHGLDGWLFPAGDVDALAGALQAVLAATPGDLELMGKQARRRVLQRHAITPQVAKLAACIVSAQQQRQRQRRQPQHKQQEQKQQQQQEQQQQQKEQQQQQQPHKPQLEQQQKQPEPQSLLENEQKRKQEQDQLQAKQQGRQQ
ncbi:MAG: glycosyltransferase family 4 protein [Massilia sp.]